MREKKIELIPILVQQAYIAANWGKQTTRPLHQKLLFLSESPPFMRSEAWWAQD